MSVTSDRRQIAREIASADDALTHFSVGKAEYISGPLRSLTAFCMIDVRKRGSEYIVDYDACLTRLKDVELDLDSLTKKIKNDEYIWTLNTYPESFTLSTFTEGRRPKIELANRICNFLINHSVESVDAVKFIESGQSDYLSKLRRFRNEELRELALSFTENRAKRENGQS